MTVECSSLQNQGAPPDGAPIVWHVIHSLCCPCTLIMHHNMFYDSHDLAVCPLCRPETDLPLKTNSHKDSQRCRAVMLDCGVEVCLSGLGHRSSPMSPLVRYELRFLFSSSDSRVFEVVTRFAPCPFSTMNILFAASSPRLHIIGSYRICSRRSGLCGVGVARPVKNHGIAGRIRGHELWAPR